MISTIEYKVYTPSIRKNKWVFYSLYSTKSYAMRIADILKQFHTQVRITKVKTSYEKDVELKEWIK